MALISAQDLALLACGEHPRPQELLGAHVGRLGRKHGVRFAVWAPNASRVSVVGSFNSWDGQADPLVKDEASGVWQGFATAARVGDLYKFEIHDRAGQRLPLKATPSRALPSCARPRPASWRRPCRCSRPGRA